MDILTLTAALLSWSLCIGAYLYHRWQVRRLDRWKQEDEEAVGFHRS